jgi:hypothetical protein
MAPYIYKREREIPYGNSRDTEQIESRSSLSLERHANKLRPSSSIAMILAES